MKKSVRVSVVHDVTGKILSVNRIVKEGRVTVLAGAGNLVLETDIDEELTHGITTRFRVDTSKKELVSNR